MAVYCIVLCQDGLYNLGVVNLSTGPDNHVSVYTMLERQCCLIVELRGCG